MRRAVMRHQKIDGKYLCRFTTRNKYLQPENGNFTGDRVKDRAYLSLLIKPYVRFSLIRLSDILPPAACREQPRFQALDAKLGF